MKQRASVVYGLLASSFVAAVGMLIISPGLTGKNPSFGIILIWIGLFYFVSVVVAFLFGLSAFLLFHHFNLVRWWSAVGTGLTIGGGFFLLSSPQHSIGFADIFSLSLISIGGLAGFTFWLVWRLVNASKRNASS